MADDYGWIKPGVKGVVDVTDEVDRDGDVKLRVPGTRAGYYYVPASALRPLPEPSPVTAAQIRVADAMLAYRREHPGHHASGPFGEVLIATDALIALTTPPDPLAVALDALRKIASRSDRSHTGCNPQVLGDEVATEARAAIAILEAAIKGKQP